MKFNFFDKLAMKFMKKKVEKELEGVFKDFKEGKVLEISTNENKVDNQLKFENILKKLSEKEKEVN